MNNELPMRNNLGAAIPASRLITAKKASQITGVKFQEILELINSGIIFSCTFEKKHYVSPDALDVLQEIKKGENTECRRSVK